jgi:hypothetical protein
MLSRLMTMKAVIGFLMGMVVVGGSLWTAFGAAASLWFLVGYLVGVGLGVWSCMTRIMQLQVRCEMLQSHADVVTGRTTAQREEKEARFLRALHAKPPVEQKEGEKP